MARNKFIKEIKRELSFISSVTTIFLLLIASAASYFHLIEKWKWLDSIYFVVVTMSTVGYGNIAPKTSAGKIGNMVLIVVGIGVFGLFINQLVKRQGAKRIEQIERFNRRLREED